jgi:[acyl-carrier-protein] S-malonyltransferase
MSHQNKVAFIFPTSGTLDLGMGQHLTDYGKHPFEDAGDIIGVNLKKLCEDGPMSELSKAQLSNVAIYSQSLATYGLLTERGIKPDMILGYSLGEYTALCATKVYNFEKGVRFLFEAGKGYQEEFSENKYGIALALNVELKELENVCEQVRQGGVEIYTFDYGLPDFNIISGEKKGIALVEKLVKGTIKPTLMDVPSHTPIVRTFESGLTPYFDELFERSNEPSLPLISGFTGGFIQSIDDISSNMRVHLSSPVQWEKSVKTMIEQGVNTFVEVGPMSGIPRIVGYLCKKNGVDGTIYTTDTPKNLEQTLKMLS